MNKEVNNEYYSRELLEKSYSSVISLWNDGKNCFIRNSKSYDDIYPTATFHALSSLLETGNKFNKDDNPIKIDSILSFFNYKKKEWIDELLSHSSNVKKENAHNEDIKIYGIRALTVIERFLSVLDGLYDLVEDKTFIKESTDRFKVIINKYFETFGERLFPESGTSPLPILNIVLIIKHYNSILKKMEKPEEFDNEIAKFKKASMAHVNYHMARFNGVYEPSFDPISLTISLYANTILSPELKYTPFFNSCLQVITQNQNNNGCWPSGVSISFSDNGDVVQLPSVEIALFIAEIVNDKNILINYNENIKETLSIVLPAFRKFAKYLDITCNRVNNKDFIGWASDRIGRRDYVETWITAQAYRFLYKLNIIEKALLRNLSLEKLGVPEFQAKSLTKDESLELWDKNVIDPDDIVKSTVAIKNNYIIPILNKKETNSYIYTPKNDAVSFIIFGPPGSGKTYFVEQISKILDFPLVEINPGHFIKNGLELIESTTKEIFDLLSNLNNAIVFFDECDELFRSREDKDKKSPSRTILSFATASMLPKLQKLHDNGKIIFILGTNYLQNIDIAIKRAGRFDDIFLLDRPCRKSRKLFIERKYEYDDAKLEEILDNTEFYSIPEIIAKCENKKESIIDEYQEWCKETGIKELDSSRYSSVEIMKIKKRWKVK